MEVNVDAAIQTETLNGFHDESEVKTSNGILEHKTPTPILVIDHPELTEKQRKKLEKKQRKQLKREKLISELFADNIVDLNVGGKHYATTLETLRRDPTSMLYAMFSGLYRVRTDKKGHYFIDRDGTYFRYILNYLRDGTVDLMNDEAALKQLLREAQFFQIQGLIKEIEDKLEQLKKGSELAKKGGQYAVAYLGGYGKVSQIYTKDTGGGFSDSCIALNKLAAEGYHIEGVCSGANGHYYAILRTNEPTSKNIVSEVTKLTQDARKP